jgi:hypothetical protein
VNVTLILDEAGRLQCAFTDPKVEWVVSADGSYEDVETKARKNRMAARPLREDERCESSVADVLGALWSRRGIDPSEPGQLVLRPRFVSRGLPAKEVDGEWVPVPLPGPYWLAEIRGMITLIKYGHYYSGQLVAMDDDLGRQDSQGTYMP